MHLFCRCHVEHASVMSEVEARLSRMETRIRQLEGEAEALHGDVRRWMRRAVAAERVVERAAEDAPGVRPTPVLLTGVRARRAARAARMLRPDPLVEQAETTEGTNGVHP